MAIHLFFEIIRIKFGKLPRKGICKLEQGNYKDLQSFATDIVHYAIDSRFCHDVLAEKNKRVRFFFTQINDLCDPESNFNFLLLQIPRPYTHYINHIQLTLHLYTLAEINQLFLIPKFRLHCFLISDLT